MDPGHINGDLLDPQSWNSYAYSENNPLRFVDLYGRYVCSAMTPAECDKFEQSRLAAESAAKKSGDQDAQASIASYGARKIDNGVTVTIGTTELHGAAETLVGTNVGPKTAQNPTGQNIMVRFDRQIFGQESTASLASIAGHEGAHVVAGAAWVGSGFRGAANPTRFAAEFKAFAVMATIARALGGPDLVFGAGVVWQSGWSAAKVNEAILTMLAVGPPKGLYGVTPASPGGPVFGRRRVVR